VKLALKQYTLKCIACLLTAWLCAALSCDEEARLEWILEKPFEDGTLSKHSHLADSSSATDVILEFGPR